MRAASGGCFGEIGIDLVFDLGLGVIIVVGLGSFVFVRDVGCVGRFRVVLGGDRRRWLSLLESAAKGAASRARNPWLLRWLLNAAFRTDDGRPAQIIETDTASRAGAFGAEFTCQQACSSVVINCPVVGS